MTFLISPVTERRNPFFSGLKQKSPISPKKIDGQPSLYSPHFCESLTTFFQTIISVYFSPHLADTHLFFACIIYSTTHCLFIHQNIYIISIHDSNSHSLTTTPHTHHILKHFTHSSNFWAVTWATHNLFIRKPYIHQFITSPLNKSSQFQTVLKFKLSIQTRLALIERLAFAYTTIATSPQSVSIEKEENML